MFGEGKHLPQLHDLTLQWPDAQQRGHLGLEQPRAPVSAPASTDLVLIIGACPALRELRVSVKPGTDLAPLQQCVLTLLHCSTLHEPSSEVQDVSTLRSMLVLTRLQELQLPGSPAGTIGDVLQLTALTSLTRLFAKVREFTAGVMDVIKLNLMKQVCIGLKQHTVCCFIVCTAACAMLSCMSPASALKAWYPMLHLCTVLPGWDRCQSAAAHPRWSCNAQGGGC